MLTLYQSIISCGKHYFTIFRPFSPSISSFFFILVFSAFCDLAFFDVYRSHAVNIRSAPRAFEFYGLLEDNGAVTEKLLLSGSYDIEQNSASQTFPVTDHYWGKFKFRYFTLKILDNHGLADYTCIYRLRVHGEPVHHRH